MRSLLRTIRRIINHRFRGVPLVLAAFALAFAPATAGAMTPEQEWQVARMRLAGVCQALVHDGLLKSCTVDQLLGKAVRP